MRHSDFTIGQDFFNAVGKWRCTDIGLRTIAAVRWPEDVEIPGRTSVNDWLKGPPYPIKEVVFDEKEISQAYRTLEEAVDRSRNSAHPGFSGQAVEKMMGSGRKRLNRKAAGEPALAADPLMDRLTRYERVVDGQILHAYDWNEDASQVHVLDVYEGIWKAVGVEDFMAGRVATEDDYIARAQKRQESLDQG